MELGERVSFLQMKAIIRVDASTTIGTGHVMRCLTLAGALTAKGWGISFVSKDHPGNLNAFVKRAGFPLEVIAIGHDEARTASGLAHEGWLGGSWEADAVCTARHVGAHEADLLIVDHYALDDRWERAINLPAKRIVVIDDLADRGHYCGLLIDANLGRVASDYSALVSDETEVVTGASYALLRPEFADARAISLARRKEPALRTILIAMGGVDAPNATACILETLGKTALPVDVRVVVVLGSRAKWLNEVRQTAAGLPYAVEIRVDVTEMASLMTASDLAIGGAGVTAWERCCLGLPALIVTIADNQVAGARALAEIGAARLVGGVDAIAGRLDALIDEAVRSDLLTRMSAAASEVTDGQGVARVVNKLTASLARNGYRVIE